MKEARTKLEVIKKCRKKKLRANDISDKAKVPFKLASIQELMVYRVVELTEAALKHFRKANLVTAMVVTRSIYETAALMNMVYYELNFAVSSGNPNSIDSFLMKALLGRNDVKKAVLRVVDIGKLIDRCEKDFPKFKDFYKHLCGYAHPNYLSTLEAYGIIDMKNRTLELGSSSVDPIQGIHMGLCALIPALSIFINRYKEIEKQLPKFTHLCEQKLNIE